MTGPIAMTGAAAIHWDNTSPVTDPVDLSKGICLYGTGTTSQFGFSITSGTLNYVVQNVGNRHNFWCGTVNTVKIEDQGVNVTGSLDTTSHLQASGGGVYATGCNMIARNGGKFQFENTDNNAWQNAISFSGGFHIQYHEGGNNDGRIRFYTANGGYSDQPVFETTIVSAGPGLKVTGSVAVGSGDELGLYVGDRWHGWAWSNTANCEHLRSYQGKFVFLKCANTANGAGEALYTIDTAGGTVNMAMSAASFVDRTLLDRPELAEFAEGEDEAQQGLVQPIRRRGINLGRVLLRALARIDELEARIKKFEGL
jgi:hypothetical protein